MSAEERETLATGEASTSANHMGQVAEPEDAPEKAQSAPAGGAPVEVAPAVGEATRELAATAESQVVTVQGKADTDGQPAEAAPVGVQAESKAEGLPETGGEVQPEGTSTSPAGRAVSPSEGEPAASTSEPFPAATQRAVKVTEAGAGAEAGPYAETFRTFRPGQIVEGRVVQVRPDEVLVDVGYKSDGVIPRAELGIAADTDPATVLQPGDKIDVTVLRVDEGEGTIVLSRRRALAHSAWKRVQRAYETGEVIEAKVTERVKGGLLADVGVRGFIPASQVGRGFVENLDQYVGQTLRLKVIELEKDRRNVVLSHRQVLEEEAEKQREAALAALEEGQIVKGVVRRLTDFGAFVDIGNGLEGLLHISEIAWSRVRHPSDVLHEGDEVQVLILRVDRERKRISLSLKQAKGDPWEHVTERYQPGQIVTGQVTRVVDFGAFVKLEDGLEGLVHISQLAPYRVARSSDVVSPGQEVPVKILSIDPVNRRISLSIRQAEEPDELDAGAGPGEGEREGATGMPAGAEDRAEKPAWDEHDQRPRDGRGERGERDRGFRGERGERGERGNRRRDRDRDRKRRDEDDEDVPDSYTAGEGGGMTIGERLGDIDLHELLETGSRPAQDS